MIWKIGLTKDSLKFLKTNAISREEIFEFVRKSAKRLQGEDLNIDIKKLKGNWFGFYRIRKGKLRIIAEFNFDDFSVLIDKIDWRGKVYK